MNAPTLNAVIVDLPLTRGQAGIAVALFLQSTACMGVLLWRVDQLGGTALAGAAACLVAGLWTIGAVLDRRLALWIGGLVGFASAAGSMIMLLYVA